MAQGPFNGGQAGELTPRTGAALRKTGSQPSLGSALRFEGLRCATKNWVPDRSPGSPLRYEGQAGG